MDEAGTDVLAYMGFPKDHWSKLHSLESVAALGDTPLVSMPIIEA